MDIKEIYPNILYDHFITSLATHSLKVKSGSVFFAILGHKQDGHEFINNAISNGALTIVLENSSYIIQNIKVNFIVVQNARKELAIVSKKLYQTSLNKKTLIAITGTNGKTSVSTLIFKYLRFLKINALLIGSNGLFYNEEGYETTNTTPDLLTIYQMIERYHEKVQYVIIEISSQAIRELRVLGLDFNLVLVTNISQDHFDYHPNWEDYVFSKGILLIGIPNDESHHIIVNCESIYYRFFDNLTMLRLISFGLNNGDYHANIIKENLDETIFYIITKEKDILITTSLVGEFNVENILAFYSVIETLKISSNLIPSFLSHNPPIAGRMERYQILNRRIIIDYAHTPEAVNHLLSFIRKETTNKLRVVIGCGGRRDRKKRPLMAENALKFSDKVYFTEDNSRGESFDQIISDMLTNTQFKNYEIIPKREDAIIKALSESLHGEVIALVGMGYERYQSSLGLVTDYDIIKRWEEQNG